MSELVTQSEFARIVGVSSPRVSTAIKHGKLLRSLKKIGKIKRIDLEEGLKEWKENLAPAQQKGGHSKKNKAKGRVTKAKEGRSTGEDVDKMSLAELQTLQAKYKALMQKINLDKELKKIIAIDQVEKEFFDIARLVRDAILAVPDKISAILAVEPDERAVNVTMTQELHAALNGLKREGEPSNKL